MLRGANQVIAFLLAGEAMPTIMIRHATDDQLREAMRLTGHTTASKALVDCVAIASKKTDESSRLRQEVYVLKQELAFSQQVIRRAKDSAAALLDHVAQGDLLNG
jgi:hypothetical protein